jgi:hypothetical protein
LPVVTRRRFGLQTPRHIGDTAKIRERIEMIPSGSRGETTPRGDKETLMKRHAWMTAIACAGLLAFGCGGDDGDGNGGDPDAGEDLANPGFGTPTATVQANGAPADFSCLNTPTGDVLSTIDINLTGPVEDFQNGTANPNAVVSAFPVVEFENVIAEATADGNGDYAMTLPAGQTRVGFKIVAEGALETYLLNQYFEPDVADQTLTVNSVSEATANTLPAFVGVTRTAGLGVLAGAIRDCSGNEVANAIATVSSVSGQPQHLEGAQTYYFSGGSPSLPVRHETIAVTNTDGLFVVLELPPSAQAFLQVWGFVDGQDPATDELTLLAEIPSPVVPDVMVTFSLEPLRN